MPNVDPLQVLLSFGLVVAIVPTGLWLLQRVGESRPAADGFERCLLAIPVGISLWSLLLVASAQLGQFDPAVLGALGWLATFAARRSVLSVFSGQGKFGVAPWRGAAALLGLGLLAWLYAAFPSETLLGDRDEGLYSLTALLLQRTRGLVIDAPAVAAVAPALFKPFNHGQPVSFFLPGIYDTGHGLQLQFPPLLPTWIAQIAAATAGNGLFRTSALFALAAVLVFHALARRLLGPAAALLATVVFALNPAQVWIARVNLVEPLARLLVLGGLLAAVIALERRSGRQAVIAGILFGVAAFGRLDMVLLAPLSLAVLVVMRAWPSPRFDGASAPMASLAASTVAGQAAAVALLGLVSPTYLRVNAAPVMAAGVATLAALTALFLCRARPVEFLRAASSRRVFAVVAAAALLLLLAYAALLRPQIEPFALIDRPGHFLHGTRDYREQSLPALAAYLGWPTVLAAAIGAAIAVARVLLGRAHAALALIVLVFVPSAVIMLSNPRISPDHFWAVRRLVPLVIPGFALLAGYGVQALLASTLGRRQGIVAGALALGAAVSLIAAQWPTLFVRENEGLSAKLESFEQSLGETSLVVVRDFDPLATTLLLGFGRPVLPLRDATAVVDAAGRQFWSRCSAAGPCMLVHFDDRGLAGLAMGPRRRVSLERRQIDRTPVPLPRNTRLEVTSLILTPLAGLDSEAVNAFGGAYRDWNVDDAGFYLEDLTASSSGRWTNGDATIRMPRIDADTLEVGFVVPGGSPRDVSIALDGVVLHDGPLAGAQRLNFALPRVDGAAGTRLLRIRSATFNPKAAGLGTETRELGVWVYAARQFDSAAPRLARSSGDASYRSRLAVTGGPAPQALVIDSRGGAAQVTIAVANEGDSVWPGGMEVQADEVPVVLGIVWRRRADGAIAHEQRVALPFALHPGERIRMSPAPDPRRSDGSVLAPGDYELEFDLLQEHVTWFAPRGGLPARVPVVVVAGNGSDR
jgi:hypothetical protein